MHFIPKNILKAIPALHANGGKGLAETMVHCEITLVGHRWAWYVAEINKKDGIAYGWTQSGIEPAFSELGYFNLNEIGSLKGTIMVSPVNFSLEFCQKNFR